MGCKNTRNEIEKEKEEKKRMKGRFRVEVSGKGWSVECVHESECESVLLVDLMNMLCFSD